MEELGKNPPTHKFIKQTFDWFFQIEDNKAKMDYNKEKMDYNKTSEKIANFFGSMSQMAESSKSNKVVSVFTVNSKEDFLYG